MKILVTIDDEVIKKDSKNDHLHNIQAESYILDMVELDIRPIYPDGREIYWITKVWQPEPDRCFEGIKVEILEDINV